MLRRICSQLHSQSNKGSCQKPWLLDQMGFNQSIEVRDYTEQDVSFLYATFEYGPDKHQQQKERELTEVSGSACIWMFNETHTRSQMLSEV